MVCREPHGWFLSPNPGATHALLIRGSVVDDAISCIHVDARLALGDATTRLSINPEYRSAVATFVGSMLHVRHSNDSAACQPGMRSQRVELQYPAGIVYIVLCPLSSMYFARRLNAEVISFGFDCMGYKHQFT